MSSAPEPGAPAHDRPKLQPILRLFGEDVTLADSGEPHRAAVLRLEFIDPSDPTANVVDPAEERELGRLLESMGAIEVSAIDDCLFDFHSEANYLLAICEQVPGVSSAPDPAAHKACSFVAQAVPKLREAGVDVRIDPSFPFPTLPPDVRFHALVEPDETMNWFDVRVGIEVDGKPYNIVPALLDLLSRAREGSTLESLARYPARYRAVRLDNGRHVVLPWSRLERILAILSEVYGGPDGQSIRLPQARTQILAALDRALCSETSAVEWRAGAEWLERARALDRGPEWTPPPAALRATLRPYQHEGLSWLEHLRDLGAGAILADDMGLGKTLQTIALLAREKEARRMDLPSLIVAPTSLVFNWALELRKFAPHLRVVSHHGPTRARLLEQWARADLVVTSYPIIIRDAPHFVERDFHYLILDEAQTIKNPDSLARVVLTQIRARHRLALSGTPVENNLTELWSVADFALPGLLGSRREFEKRFQTPIEEGFDRKRLRELRERISPFLLRRTKESVAKDLPPKTEMTRAVELRGAQRDLYESIRLAADQEVRAAIKNQGISGSAITILDALMKLRQVCCDPRLLSQERAKDVRESAKFEYFLGFLKDQLRERRRVLVFSQFAKMLGLLGDGLRAEGIDSICLHGQTKNREELVTRFERGEVDVFLISLKAGGTGLNLVSADTVIHYDPWWNAAAQMQATDRAYRIGQKKPVFVYNLIAQGSVEERMLALQARKRRLAENLLAQDSGPFALREAELESLFRPLDPTDTLGERHAGPKSEGPDPKEDRNAPLPDLKPDS